MGQVLSFSVVTKLQSIRGRFKGRVRETCRPKEIRLCLSSQRKQPVPDKYPYERSRQAKASRHGQKHLSGGDIYFGGPFIMLGRQCRTSGLRHLCDQPGQEAPGDQTLGTDAELIESSGNRQAASAGKYSQCLLDDLLWTLVNACPFSRGGLLRFTTLSLTQPSRP